VLTFFGTSRILKIEVVIQQIVEMAMAYMHVCSEFEWIIVA